MSSVKQIADSFVGFYYQSLHENPAKLHPVYTADAQLTHSKIPDGPGVNFISKGIDQYSLSSKTEIEAFYADSKLAESKIRVSSIDCQTFDKAILISVVGELALKEGVAVYRFTQSFILKPTGTTTYDIANDIFRLIPDEDYELNNTLDGPSKEAEEATEEPEATTITTETENGKEDDSKVPETPQTPEKKAEEEEIKQAEPVVEASKEVEKEETPLEGPKEESTPTPAAEEAKEAQPIKAEEPPKEAEEAETVAAAIALEEEKSAEKAKEQVEEEKEKEKPVKAVAPGSWAQAASFSSGKPVQPKVTKPAVKKSTPSAETAQAPLSDVTNTQKPQAQAQQQKRKTTTAAVASEFQFTIRVKEVDRLNADQIRRSFEKEFGRVLRAEPRGHWALVAFETREGMEKALGRKKIKIEDNTVTMDAKPSDITFSTGKRKPGQSNGNGKGPVNKDNKQQQQPQQQQQQKAQNRRKK